MKKNTKATPQKRGKGRPPKPPTERKKSFSFPFTEEEFAVFEAAAKASGKPTRTWCRETLIEAAQKILDAQ